MSHLFYVPKEKIIQAFLTHGLQIDYPDKSPETEKNTLASTFEAHFTQENKVAVTNTLVKLVGNVSINSYVDRVKARLSALPQEIRIVLRHEASPKLFKSVDEVAGFLENPSFQMDNPQESYLYQITYSDGSEFETVVDTLEELRELNLQLQKLTQHMSNL